MHDSLSARLSAVLPLWRIWLLWRILLPWRVVAAVAVGVCSFLIVIVGTCCGCGPFFAESYLVDGINRGRLVMTLPEGIFSLAIAQIYTNQPPAQTNLFCAAYGKGRACLDKREFKEAARWFEQCQAQSRSEAYGNPGCADRSVGWQALAELHGGDYPACIRHYYECGDRRSLVSYVLPALARRGKGALDEVVKDDAALRVLAAYRHVFKELGRTADEPFRPDAYFRYETPVQPTSDEARNAAAFIDNLNHALAARGTHLPPCYDDVLVNVLRRHPDRYAIAEAFDANDETLAGIVRDDTSRRVLTAWVISRSRFLYATDDENSGYRDKSARLLVAIERALTNRHVADVDGILRLAYDAGNYDAAERWLALSDKQSVIAQWIQSKLLLRQGRFDDARAVLHHLLPKITPSSDAAELCAYDEPDCELETLLGVPDASNGMDYCRAVTDPRTCTARVGRIAAMVNSEIGLIELKRNDFLMAFDAFVRGKTWEDMAYVAEKVLTCEELEGYLRQHAGEPALQENENGTHLGYVLARRYARARQWNKALEWMPSSKHPWLERFPDGGSVSQHFARFVCALAQAQDARRPPEERADGYGEAGRAVCMEVMGTETGPDWACYFGQYTKDEGWYNERTVQRYASAPIEQTEPKETIPHEERTPPAATGTEPLYHATTVEISRVNTAWPTPCKRFHYRYYAVDLLWQGAALLPRNSEKAARMLHDGGTLLMSRDPRSADRFHKEIVNRHGRTELGKRVRTKNWFLRESEWAAYLGSISVGDACFRQQHALRIPTSDGTGWIAVAIGTIQRVAAQSTQNYLRVVLSLEGVPDSVNAYEAEFYDNEGVPTVEMTRLAMPSGRQAIMLTRQPEPTALRVGYAQHGCTYSVTYKAQEGTNRWEYTTAPTSVARMSAEGTPLVIAPPRDVNAHVALQTAYNGEVQLLLTMNPTTRCNGGHPPTVVRVQHQTPNGSVCVSSQTNTFHNHPWEKAHADVELPDEEGYTIETAVDLGPLGGTKTMITGIEP